MFIFFRFLSALTFYLVIFTFFFMLPFYFFNLANENYFHLNFSYALEANTLLIGVLCAVFLAFISYVKGTKKIITDLEATSLNTSLSQLQTIVNSAASKLAIATPEVLYFDSRSANIVSLKKWSGKFYIIISTEMIISLQKEEVIAMLEYEMIKIKYGAAKLFHFVIGLNKIFMRIKAFFDDITILSGIITLIVYPACFIINKIAFSGLHNQILNKTNIVFNHQAYLDAAFIKCDEIAKIIPLAAERKIYLATANFFTIHPMQPESSIVKRIFYSR